MYNARDYLFIMRHSSTPASMTSKPLITRAPSSVIDVPSVAHVHSIPAGPIGVPPSAAAHSSPSTSTSSSTPASPATATPTT
jgi:hypothetical protein